MKCLMLLAILSLATSCATKTIKEPVFDMCYSGGSSELRCFPVNQSDRAEYNRVFDPLRDFVLDINSYSELSKHHKVLHKRLKSLEKL